MSRNYNTEIAQVVRNHLDAENWSYRFEEDDGVFRFGLNLRGKLKSVQYVIGINEKDYNVYAISPISADQRENEQMLRLAEFICRVNYGLRNGNFELDFNDGELRYKCYVSCEGAMPTEEVVRDSINCPAAMFTRYSEGLLQLLFNDMSPVDAVALCERDRAAPMSQGGNDESAPEGLLELLRKLQDEHEGDGADDAADTGE